jgi:hypothetical protein
MKRVIRIIVVGLLFATAAWAQQVQVSVSYLYQGSNELPGATDWFSANGGRADAEFGNWRHLGLVAEVAGARAASLTTITYLAGPRRSLALGRAEKRKVSAFAQVLAGGVHACDGAFSNGTTGDAFALSVGGGLEAHLSRGVTLRLIQADYLYTRLPNLHDNYESNFRLGVGVSFRLR